MTGATNIWTIAVALATLPILLRGLGTEAFGVWALIQTFSATSGWLSLGDLGLTASSTRFVAEAHASGDEAGLRRAVGTAMTLFAGVALASGVTVALGGVPVLRAIVDPGPTVEAALPASIAWFGASAVLDQIGRGIQSCLEGVQRADLSRLLDALRRTGTLLACAAAAFFGRGLDGVFSASLAASAVGLIVTLAVGVRRLPLGSMWFDRGVGTTMLRYGRTIAVLRPLGVIQRSMDRIIVAAALGPQAVAVVEIAAQLQNGATAIMGASSYAVMPGASWLSARNDPERLRTLVLTGSRYTAIVTAAACVPAICLATPLIAVWIGDGHRAVVPATLALLVTLGQGFSQCGSDFLVGIGRADRVLRAAVVAVIANLALSVALVGRFGVSGVFAATLVCEAFLGPALIRSTTEEIDMSTTNFFRRVVAPVAPAVLVAATATIAVRTAPLSNLPVLVVGGGVGIVAYAVTVARTGLDPGEMRGLVAAVRPDRSRVGVS